MQNNESCKCFENKKELLQVCYPIFHFCVFPSFTFIRYSTDVIVDNVQLSVKDDARVKRKNGRILLDGQGSSCNLNSYMTNIRAVAGVQENHFSSKFLLENNHDKVDNQFDMSHDHLM